MYVHFIRDPHINPCAVMHRYLNRLDTYFAGASSLKCCQSCHPQLGRFVGTGFTRASRRRLIR